MNLDDLKDTGFENFEVLLDSFMQEGIAKEIPIIKTVIALFITSKSIKDYLFVRKLCAFLNSTKYIAKYKIDKFKIKLESENTKKEVGVKILQIIERLDELRKAQLLGSIFKLLIKEKIDKPIFFRLSYLIDKCFYDDLMELKHFEGDKIILQNNDIISSAILENLQSNGFLSNNGFDGGNFSDDSNNGTRFGMNQYSKIIIKVL